MGDENDPQRIKKIAAAAYQYEIDPRWAEYWSNVLIPPHMASRSDIVDHYKRKFYQRYIDPNFVVQPMSSSSSFQTSRSSERSTSVPTTENKSPHNSGSASEASAPQSRISSSLQLDKQTFNFAFNSWVFAMSILGILPLVPKSLAGKAYLLSLLGAAFSSLFSLYTRFGVPRTWNQQGIHTWLQSVIATREFINLPYSIMLSTSSMPFKIGLVPVLCWSVQHVVKFSRKSMAHSNLYRKYLDEPCLWVDVNATTINILSSNAEVALGFLFLISLFSQRRSIIHTFMYWQLLKLMYHVPATSGYHQSVWSKIDRAINPFVNRYAPFLNAPISAIRKWWSR
ncbi:uncharacterized protein LOC110026612 [Phalaenopsis equestris]|uniref:uncharacterized protein LOC110026612 n=1 Tax=Phalaenopsis equestris TaxID=78828 RepID=UPI0009E566B9|nr:uncharacterized protein LOC110026612 [Phalaenopsis equestris]